jgi:hypothetical protein
MENKNNNNRRMTMKRAMMMMAALAAVMAFATPGMAADVSMAPTNWIAGYTSDGTNMVIPIASLPYLDAGQCSAETGDVRQIVFAIQEEIYQKWILIPATNRSDRIGVARSSVVYSNRIANTYSYRADLAPVSLVVLPE